MKSSKLIFQGFRTWHNFYLNRDESLNERQSNLAYDLVFKNTSSLTVSELNREVNLQFSTNFLGSEFNNLTVGNYNFTRGTISYNSDTRNQFRYNPSASYGEFFNGKITTLSASGNMRFGYWGNFGLSYNYNNIQLPENYGNVDLHLLRFRGLVSFTNKLFVNSTIQYNSQSENFSVFSRLQWRYTPLSDIFLIYNQNNNTNTFDLSNRSIILKLTHRFAV